MTVIESRPDGRRVRAHRSRAAILAAHQALEALFEATTEALLEQVLDLGPVAARRIMHGLVLQVLGAAR